MSVLGTVWLDGRFVPAARARIAATSTSVSHGIGVFETMRVVGGSVPLWELHAIRARSSCEAASLTFPQHDYADVLTALARKNRVRSAVGRLTVGDGFVLITLARLPRGLSREAQEGIALPSLPLARPAATLKATSWLPLVLAERQAGGEVLLTSAGRVLETSRSNLFVLRNDTLETAPTPSVLPGIARGLVSEFARNRGVRIRLRSPRLSEAGSWSEVFVTNALRGVRPVVQIDGEHFAAPHVTSLTRLLQGDLKRRMRLA